MECVRESTVVYQSVNCATIIFYLTIMNMRIHVLLVDAYTAARYMKVPDIPIAALTYLNVQSVEEELIVPQSITEVAVP
jgi:hypothetical protein